MRSDGESDQASEPSSDEVQSPVKVRMRPHNHHHMFQRRFSQVGTNIHPLGGAIELLLEASKVMIFGSIIHKIFGVI